MTLRRQSIGGGDLARIGVSAAELGRYGVSGNAPDKADYGSRPAHTELERIQRRMIRDEVAQGTGMARAR